MTESPGKRDAEVGAASGAPLPKSASGLLYGVAAHAIWGVIPLYFHALAAVPPFIILCHRVLWSALFLALVVAIRGEWKLIREILRSRPKMLLLSAGAVLIALNWLIFIYAVISKQLLQASLGYFINPLLSIALGMVFLRERLRGWQWLAVLLAAAGIANLALRGATFPWIALTLAISFGFYGLVRKKVNLNSLHGLLIESSLLLPLALVTLVLLPVPKVPGSTWFLLSLSGIITAIPLLFFGAALRLLKLSTMGFLQYVGPTLQFLVATVIFHEPLSYVKIISFSLCWLAILVYMAESVLTRNPQPVADEPE